MLFKQTYSEALILWVVQMLASISLKEHRKYNSKYIEQLHKIHQLTAKVQVFPQKKNPTLKNSANKSTWN